MVWFPSFTAAGHSNTGTIFLCFECHSRKKLQDMSLTNTEYALRSRIAELELLVAQQSEVIHDLTQQQLSGAGQRSGSGHVGNGLNVSGTSGTLAASDASAAGVSSHESVYHLQKQLVQLTDQRNQLEGQVQRLNESATALQLNLTREIQRAREEGERQTVFLRAQLMEAKEHAMALQEKLVGHVGAADVLRHAGLEDMTTERMLITSDAVLHRLQVERPLKGTEAKYGVTVEFTGRTMILSGRKINIQLLKADVFSILNEMYATMADPVKYVPAAKAREQAKAAELEHARRTIATLETAVQSLHTAVQHAQERSDAAVVQTQLAKQELALTQEKCASALSYGDTEKAELQREIHCLRAALEQAEKTSQLGLKSLQSEAALGAAIQQENENLRKVIADVTSAKELAERVAYVATEQAKATQGTFSELLAKAECVERETRRAEIAERDLHKALEKGATAQADEAARRGAEQEERGRLLERVAQAQHTADERQEKIDAITKDRDTARLELRRVQQLLADARDMDLGAFTSPEEREALAAATVAAAANQGPSAATGQKAQAGTTVHHVTLRDAARGIKLEHENATLRKELERAFEDMKTIAVAMRDTKGIKERALHDVERLEIERQRLVEERQRSEMLHVQERMVSRTRESELQLQIDTLKDEIDHQKKRVTMLHVEYQKRIGELMPNVAPSQTPPPPPQTMRPSGWLPPSEWHTPLKDMTDGPLQQPPPSGGASSSSVAGGISARASGPRLTAVTAAEATPAAARDEGDLAVAAVEAMNSFRVPRPSPPPPSLAPLPRATSAAAGTPRAK